MNAAERLADTTGIGLPEPPALSLGLLRTGYPPGEVWKVEPDLKDMRTRLLRAWEVLVREGEPPGDAYIVHEGILQVFKRRKDGALRLVAELGPGSLVGEMSLLSGEPRSATVIAKSPARLYVMTPRLFGLLIRSSQVFAERVARLVGSRKTELAKI